MMGMLTLISYSIPNLFRLVKWWIYFQKTQQNLHYEAIRNNSQRLIEEKLAFIADLEVFYNSKGVPPQKLHKHNFQCWPP